MGLIINTYKKQIGKLHVGYILKKNITYVNMNLIMNFNQLSKQQHVNKINAVNKTLTQYETFINESKTSCMDYTM